MDNYNYQPDNNQNYQNGYPQGGPYPGQQQPGSAPGQNLNPGYGQNPNYNPQAGPYPGQGYSQPYQGYSQGPVVINQLEHKRDNLAVCSLVFGIMGGVFSWILVIPLVCCIAGLIMGIISLVKTGQHTGLALGGVIVSAISLVISVVFTLLYIVLL